MQLVRAEAVLRRTERDVRRRSKGDVERQMLDDPAVLGRRTEPDIDNRDRDREPGGSRFYIASQLFTCCSCITLGRGCVGVVDENRNVQQERAHENTERAIRQGNASWAWWAGRPQGIEIEDGQE